jgi:hypothetical protein
MHALRVQGRYDDAQKVEVELKRQVELIGGQQEVQDQ